jgi:hypothetical protein
MLSYTSSSCPPRKTISRQQAKEKKKQSKTTVREKEKKNKKQNGVGQLEEFNSSNLSKRSQDERAIMRSKDQNAGVLDASVETNENHKRKKK